MPTPKEIYDPQAMQSMFMLEKKDVKTEKEISRIRKRLVFHEAFIALLLICEVLFGIIYFLNIEITSTQSGRATVPQMAAVTEQKIKKLEESLKLCQDRLINMSERLEHQRQTEIVENVHFEKKFEVINRDMNDSISTLRLNLKKLTNESENQQKRLSNNEHNISKIQINESRNFALYNELYASQRNFSNIVQGEKIMLLQKIGDLRSEVSNNISSLANDLKILENNTVSYDQALIQFNKIHLLQSETQRNFSLHSAQISNQSSSLNRIIQSVNHLWNNTISKSEGEFLLNKINELENESRNNFSVASENMERSRIDILSNISDVENTLRVLENNTFSKRDGDILSEKIESLQNNTYQNFSLQSSQISDQVQLGDRLLRIMKKISEEELPQTINHLTAMFNNKTEDIIANVSIMSDAVSGKTDLLYVQLERSNNLLESNVTELRSTCLNNFKSVSLAIEDFDGSRRRDIAIQAARIRKQKKLIGNITDELSAHSGQILQQRQMTENLTKKVESVLILSSEMMSNIQNITEEVNQLRTDTNNNITDSVQLISNDIIKLSHNSTEVQDKIIDEMAMWEDKLKTNQQNFQTVSARLNDTNNVLQSNLTSMLDNINQLSSDTDSRLNQLERINFVSDDDDEEGEG